jgi:hypothetical protein
MCSTPLKKLGEEDVHLEDFPKNKPTLYLSTQIVRSTLKMTG